LDEPLDAGGERVVRVVYQDLVAPDGGEHVGRRRRLDVRQLAVGGGQERPKLVLGAVEVGDGIEAGQVERTGQRERLLVADTELALEQVEHVRVDGLFDLEPYRRTEAAPHQLPFHRGEQV